VSFSRLSAMKSSTNSAGAKGEHRLAECARVQRKQSAHLEHLKGPVGGKGRDETTITLLPWVTPTRTRRSGSIGKPARA